MSSAAMKVKQAGAAPAATVVELYLLGLGAGTRRVARQSLEAIARFHSHGLFGADELAWEDLAYPDIVRIRSFLQNRYAPGTANRHLVALRGVLKEEWRAGLMSTDQLLRVLDMKRIRGGAVRRGRALTGEEQAQLEGACDSGSVADRRDRALLALLRYLGLRRAEVAALDVADVRGREATVRHGKGGRSRTLRLPPAGELALLAWLEVRGQSPGPLLCSVDRRDRPTGRRLSGEGIAFIVRRIASRAGVDALTPHSFRYGFVSDLLQLGLDIGLVQRAAGHATWAATAIYDRRPDEQVAAASELLEPAAAGLRRAC